MYHPGLPPLRSILEKHSSILGISKRLKQFAERNPPLVAYRCLPNLKTLLVRATFKQKHLSYKGNFLCQQTRCKMCDHVKPIKRFKSLATGKTYSTKLRQIVKQPMWSMWSNVRSVTKSMLEKRRMRSTYEWTSIDRILNINVWKNQWLLILTLKATPCKFFYFHNWTD